MTDDVKPEVIKKTQDSLGKYFRKPPLTEKLLKKPPFRFLHDIVSAVIKETGFLDGLFTEEELNSENIKDKEAKLAYLTKLIEVIKLISGAHLTVRASKIISGQEPTKTNELLQAIGKALEKKVSSAEAIAHYKKSLEKKVKSRNKSAAVEAKKDPKEEERKDSSRHGSQGKKHSEKEKSSAEQRGRSSSVSKGSVNESDRRDKNKRNKDRVSAKPDSRNNEIHENSNRVEASSADPIRDKTPGSAQRRKHSPLEKPKHSSSSENTKHENSKLSSSGDNKIEEHSRKRESANRIKRSAQIQNKEPQSPAPNIVNSFETKAENNTNLENANKDINAMDDQEQKSPKENHSNKDLQNGEKMEEASPEAKTNLPKTVDESVSQQTTTRPRTSLRPPTARPVSARPAAPRMRAKTELIVNEDISTPMGNIAVIVENADTKDDDDAEDMIVMETRTSGNDVFDSGGTYKIDNELTQEHGHLVAQILETQKELVNSDNVDVIPKKTDIAWDTMSKRDREVVVKEIDKLRGTIQMLTRATNPLGKLIDYLQEDVEMMHKEYLDWRSQSEQLNKQLEIEKIQTKELIEPMKDTLKEIDDNMKSQLDKICQVKSQISKNEQKIQKLLNGNI